MDKKISRFSNILRSIRDIFRKEVYILHPFGRANSETYTEDCILIIRTVEVRENSTIFYRFGTQSDTVRRNFDINTYKNLHLKLPKMLNMSVRKRVVLFHCISLVFKHLKSTTEHLSLVDLWVVSMTGEV